jgi:predicted O-linked N-acetylglucosamine transferase (SPINDLY family)
MSAMDYKITDVHLDPPGMTEPFHSERMLRLGGCYWCYRPPENCPDVNALPAASDGGRVTFGALNAFAKVNAGVLRLWARVLEATPGSRLLLLVAGGEKGNEGVRRMIADAGISQDRVEFLGRAARADFHRYFHRVDISLDPFPYNGHTTSLDSLWMGVPVVTLEGDSPVGRAGVSILTNLGLPELIARDEDEYVAKGGVARGGRAGAGVPAGGSARADAGVAAVRRAAHRAGRRGADPAGVATVVRGRSDRFHRSPAHPRLVHV